MKYFFILIINILTFNLFAQDMCDVFWDEMRKETNNLSLYNPLDIEIQNYGFDIVNTNHPIDDDLRYIDESRTEFFEEEISNLELFNHFYFMDFAVATSPVRKDYNLCLDNNCLDNKSISKIVNSDEYIVIDYFYHLYADDYFLNNEHVLIDWNYSDKNSDLIDWIDDSYTFVITKIDNKDISSYSDLELFKIFYTEQTIEREFNVYAFNTAKILSNNEYNIQDVVFDFKFKVVPSTYKISPLRIDFKFQDNFSLSTINKEVKYNYYTSLSWLRNDLDQIAEKISNDYMDGRSWYCSLNYDEWLDSDLIAYLPEINTDYTDIIFDNKDINIRYEYLTEYGLTGRLTYPSNLITANQDLNLRNFPFDKQEIILNFYFPALEHYKTLFFINISDLEELKKITDIEWNATDLLIDHKYYEEISLYEEIGYLNLVIGLERAYNYYLYKVYLPILLVMLMLYSSFFIPSKQIESKLTLTVVSFLALIAYIFIVDDIVPKLPYMTLMDYFIIASFIFAAFPNFWSIYSFNYLQKNAQNHYLDNKIGHVQLIIFITVVIIIFIIGANTYPESSSSVLSSLIGN